MSRYSVEYFTCNFCGKTEETLPINISINTAESGGDVNFCSFECFRQYFNNLMKEEKIEVEIMELV